MPLAKNNDIKSIDLFYLANLQKLAAISKCTFAAKIAHSFMSLFFANGIMRKLFLLFLCICNSLTSEVPNNLADTETNPAALVHNIVNVITGNCKIFKHDLTISGAEPIYVKRLYISGHGENGGWNLFPHQRLYYRKEERGFCARVTTAEPNGSSLFFYKKEKNKTTGTHFAINKRIIGYTNWGRDHISGRSNIMNTRLVIDIDEKYAHVYAPDGTERIYKRLRETKRKQKVAYHLLKERLPSGNIIRYNYDKYHRLDAITTKNEKDTKVFAKCKLHYLTKRKKRPEFDLITDDGRVISYRFRWDSSNRKYFLKSVDSPEHPKEVYTYDFRHEIDTFIKKTKTEQGPRLKIKYYKKGDNWIRGRNIKIKDEKDPRIGCVRALKAPVGNEGNYVTIYSFEYRIRHDRSGHTDVYDAHDNCTRYSYDRFLRLRKINHYSSRGKRLNKELFLWGKKEHAGRLKAKILLNENKQPLVARTFTYDKWGNITQEKLYGNVTGRADIPLLLDEEQFPIENGIDCYVKTFAYTQDGRNLLVREQEGAKKVCYTYMPDRDLVLSKFIYDKDRLCMRTFYKYENNLLICEITDDGTGLDPNDLEGISLRKIRYIHRKKEAPYLGMPEVLEEKYLDLDTLQEKQIQKTTLTYTNGAKIASKSIYDANNEHLYTLKFAYDQQGNLISETNPLGQKAVSTYDSNGNRITHKPFHGRSQEKNHYDREGRMCLQTETGKNGELKSTHFSYDSKSRCSKTVDPYGVATQFSYDPFGHLISTSCSGVRTWKKYNALGHLIEEGDPRGYRTKIQPNVYGQPLQIIYPDQTCEKSQYNLNGTLAKTINPEGGYITYTYDFLKRITSKKTYSVRDELLLEEHFHYNSFHLLESIDPMGVVTTYIYDFAGRKKEEITADITTTYSYDSMGRLKEKRIGQLTETYTYDPLNRLVEQTTEDQSWVAYKYDSFGNRTSILRSIDGKIANEHSIYDNFNRLIRYVDAFGHATTTVYNTRCYNKRGENILCKTITNPLGVQTIETYNTLGQIVKKKRLSSFGELLFKETYTYDPSSNCISQVTTIVSEKGKRKQTILRDYDSKNRLITLTQSGMQEQKVTRFKYDTCGRVQCRINPDGVKLHYTYTPLGKLHTLTSSDETIDHSFAYNKRGQIIQTNDTMRKYDLKGNLLKETLGNGLILRNSYDALGRRTELKLPDDTFIEYIYGPLHLNEITRKNAAKEILYTHQFTKYDLSGNLLEEKNSLITLTHSYNLNGQKDQVSSSYFRETVLKRDFLGNIQTLEANGKTTHYHYNDHSQLIEEPGKTYSYDSLHNRLSKNHQPYETDEANQLIRSNHAHYAHDRCGNPIEKKNQDGTSIHYKYDALGELIQAEKEHHWRLTFAYDSLQRRISKTQYVWQDEGWIQKNHENFLYDKELEIGATDPSGNIKQLRLLGPTPKADIGSAVAIELNQKFYFPIHDLQGNIKALIDPSTEQIVEEYAYSAFGEEVTPSKLNNPWRYRSKRIEELLGFIFFGRRYYEPDTGRFFTPDPKGFVDGLNLYAYCFNNPLNRLDLMGLQVQNVHVEWHIPLNQQTWNRTVAVANFIGDMLYALSYHLMPVPPVRQFIMGIGNLLSGIHRSLSSPPSSTKSTNGKKYTGVAIMSLNGILNDEDNADVTAHYVSKSVDGASIDRAHNTSRGLVLDLLESLGGIMGMQTEASAHLAQDIRDRITSLKLTTENPTIFILAHSQGGIVLRNALRSLTPEERKMIHAYTFGSPCLFQDDSLGKLRHYVASNDPVPFFSPIQRIKASLAPGSNNVEVLPSHGKLFDHFFLGDTYSDQIKKVGNDIYNFLESK